MGGRENTVTGKHVVFKQRAQSFFILAFLTSNKGKRGKKETKKENLSFFISC